MSPISQPYTSILGDLPWDQGKTGKRIVRPNQKLISTIQP